jgi:hypothetical protein
LLKLEISITENYLCYEFDAVYFWDNEMIVLTTSLVLLG